MSRASNDDGEKVTNNDIEAAAPENFEIVDVHPMRVVWGASDNSSDARPGEIMTARVELDITESLQVVSSTTRRTDVPEEPLHDSSVLLESNIDFDANEYVIKTRYGPDEVAPTPERVHQIAVDTAAGEMERLVDENPSLEPL